MEALFAIDSFEQMPRSGKLPKELSTQSAREILHAHFF